ncbi:MAG: SPFH/Band 7/PHB domain protein [Ruminococcus sp.]|nr:SPFH/Band 7/PHB domain protein [Ruminococcus sp.]
MGFWALLAVIVFIFIILLTRIKIVPQSNIYVVERLGAFYKAWETGIHFLVPFLDRVSKKVSIKEQVLDFKPQAVITKDNVTMQIDTIVFFQVTNAVQFTYGVERPISAIENLTATTLRNIIGELELDATLSSRDLINTKITGTLDHATDRWGIKVIRVELKNILPPAEIRDAMEKQMKAEREKREKILQAEAEKSYQVTVAEGEKESKILRAEADKQTAILRAEAQKEATILQGEAVREQKIRIAEGEAQSIEVVQKALAESLVQLNQANPNAAVLQLKALEAFAKAADGQATKIIIPSEIQGLAGLAAGLKGVIEDKSVEKNSTK